MPRRNRVVALVALSLLPVLGVGVSVVSASGSGAGVAEVASPRAPKLMVIKIHADWCPHCKSLNEPFDAARTALGQEPVLFVKFDNTNDQTKAQTELLFAALGLDGLWDAHGSKNGYIIVVDGASREVVETFKGGTKADAIQSAIRARLGG